MSKIKIIFKETKFFYLVQVKIRILWVFWLPKTIGYFSKSYPNSLDSALDCYSATVRRISSTKD